MVISEFEESHSIYGDTLVLKEMKIVWQILDTLCIQQTQIVIASYKDFVLIWQLYEPVQEVQHFILCAIMADVTTMNENVSFW
jgi:hypothetical protein